MSRTPVPALPKSSGAWGLQQAAIADTVDDPGIVLLDHARAHRLHGLAGGQHVLALEQAGDGRAAACQPAEHQRPVGDGLVSGDADRAAQFLGFVGDGRPQLRAMGHGFRLPDLL